MSALNALQVPETNAYQIVSMTARVRRIQHITNSPLKFRRDYRIRREGDIQCQA
jgi:hypothetical protein